MEEAGRWEEVWGRLRDANHGGGRLLKAVVAGDGVAVGPTRLVDGRPNKRILRFFFIALSCLLILFCSS